MAALSEESFIMHLAHQGENCCCESGMLATGQRARLSTATGRASAREATILVLLLPFLILCFGIAVAAMALLI